MHGNAFVNALHHYAQRSQEGSKAAIERLKAGDIA